MFSSSRLPYPKSCRCVNPNCEMSEVCTVLEDPARLEQEDQRRDEALREPSTPADRRASAAQRRTLEQGLARLIDSYTEGLLLKEEFAPRLGRLRQRLAALEEQARQDA